MIILFYINYAFRLGKDIYPYIIEIQRILFYTKKDIKNEYVKLEKKEKLNYYIKNIVMLFLNIKNISNKKEENIIETIENEKLKEKFNSFLKEYNTNLSTFQRKEEETILLIIVLFYSQLIIFQDNWYLIWIDEKYDVNTYLCSTSCENFQVDSTFFEGTIKDKNNHAIPNFRLRQFKEIKSKFKKYKKIINFVEKIGLKENYDKYNFIYCFSNIEKIDILKKT